MNYKLVLSCTTFYYFIVTVPALMTLIVTTTGGPIKGMLNKYKTMEYYSYLGIPYAENPTGPLRFMPPVRRKPWTTLLDATREGPVCAQIPERYKLHQMSEDCLNINVYVPVRKLKRLLPVAVVLHGGAMQSLSGNADYIYGPQLILERGIIVVGLNYRLGPLGFLSLDIEEASGNAALKDLILSLEWIQQNIHNFGGNNKNITIIGHSSGAVLAHYLTLTKKSKGLFQQVVFLSGSALSPRAFAKHPKLISLALARELGLNTSNVYEILKHLQYIDVHKMLKAYSNMGKRDDGVLRQFSAFVPSKEKESSHAIITADPVLFFRNNNKLPINITIMAGISPNEGLIMAPTIIRSQRKVRKLLEYPEYCIPSNIEYPINSQKSKLLGRSIRDLYFGREKMVEWINVVEKVTNVVSDIQYIYGIYFWTKQLKKLVESSPLFFYIFDFDGDLNWCKSNYNINMPGTAHSDEMGYIFITNATKSKMETADTRSLKMVNTMLSLLSNFISYGNPTPNNRSCIKWPDYGKDQTYILISDNLAIKNFHSCELYGRMQYWENVYNEYYEYLEKGGKIENKIFP